MSIKATTLLLSCLAALSACERQGPFERAGEEVDEAIEDARAGGETTGNRIDDAIDEARDRASDAADEIEEAVDDATR